MKHVFVQEEKLNIIYQNGYSEEDIIFRILLFKTFNNIDTWKKLENILGKIVYNEYDIERYGKLLNDYYMKGEKLYSGAYIMASGKTAFGQERKFMNHLMLIDYMMKDNITKKIVYSRSLEEVYHLLLTYPTIGTFLAYQYAIDINYSELIDFNEMEFVVAGPGAKAGMYVNIRPDSAVGSKKKTDNKSGICGCRVGYVNEWK